MTLHEAVALLSLALICLALVPGRRGGGVRNPYEPGLKPPPPPAPPEKRS